MTLPTTLAAFKKHDAKFRAWVTERGSAVLKPTNKYEVMRFMTDQGTGIVYRNEADRITTWVNGADMAFIAFVSGGPWRATKRGNRNMRQWSNKIATLAERDGEDCMYCGAPVTTEDVTIEHILSVTHGGTGHMANLALAHRKCNSRASHLAVREKLEMAIRLRCEPAPAPLATS